MTEVNEQLLETVKQLDSEISTLKDRVTYLENQLAVKGRPSDLPALPAPAAADDGLITKAASKPKSGLRVPALTSRLDWEDFVGGKLLNRMGALALIVGIAYFLKYSFDNDWIGELGRIVLGFTSGIGFMVAGHLFQRRNYPYFSQGLTGTGLAIIYLSTYFAANYYHLISHQTAFALLCLAALSGGLLSVVQDTYGVALLSTVGGFLTPFLAGSPEGSQLALLGYIAILDAAILFLAYFKNWKSLNSLAFAGTVLCVVLLNQISNVPSGSLSQYVWLKQAFLTLYFLMFAGLPFLFSFRNQIDSQASDILLSTGNAVFYFALSYWNLSVLHQEHWMGYVALFMGLFYLVFLTVAKRHQWGSALFYQVSNGLGMAFSVISVPLQLEGPWVKPAWLAGALVLGYSGTKGESIWLRFLGILVLGVTTLSLIFDYPAYSLVPILNRYFPALILAAFGFFTLFALFRRERISEMERIFVWIFLVCGSGILLYTIHNEVYNLVYYFYLDKSYVFLISLTWALMAVGMIITGIKRNINELRLVSLGLFALTTLRVILYDLAHLEMVFKIIILLAVGSILLGVSFLYQKREREVE